MGVSALEKSEFTLGADSIFRPSLLVNKIRNVTLEICFLGVLDLTLCAIIFKLCLAPSATGLIVKDPQTGLIYYLNTIPVGTILKSR